MRLELTPLIDVVFLLLTFFVFSLVLTVRADLLDVELPALGGGGPPAGGATIVVAITSDGSLSINGDPLEPGGASGTGALVETVRIEREANPEARLIVASDTGAPAGRLIEVFGRLTEAGLGEFAIIGRPPSAGGGADDGGSVPDSNPE